MTGGPGTTEAAWCDKAVCAKVPTGHGGQFRLIGADVAAVATSATGVVVIDS